MHPNKIKNIFSLSPKDRYGYLLRTVADFESIYLIVDNNNKYVMIGSDKINSIPVFPEKEFAELFLINNWKNYNVEEYSIYDFIEWLDDLNEKEILISGFPNLELKTVTPTPEQIKNHLLFECSRYE